MNDSPRMGWVKAHASELIEIAGKHGARDVALCGSVARGDDHDESDLDFFVGAFAETDDDFEDYMRATALVDAFRALSPYRVDMRPLPGWLLGEEHEATMRRDSIALSDLVGS